jgi:hypothetical protein
VDLYAEPYDAQRPQICFDESPVQRVSETRCPLPPRLGQAACYDYEYQREGTANLFLCVQPLLGWRQVNVTAQRTKQDFAHQMKRLVEVYFPQAEVIRLVVEISTPIRRQRCRRRLRPPRLAGPRASWSFTTRSNVAVGSIWPNANSRFLRHSVWIAGSQILRS